VLLHLEVPRELVLASYFGGWHSVLNSAVLYPPELADEEDETVYDAWQRTADERVRALGGSLDVPVHQWPQAARAYAEGTCLDWMQLGSSTLFILSRLGGQ
jgi:hypothetical protein